MTVLVDTGVVYADHDTDANRHDGAASALDAVYDGELGQPYVSDYVYDEAVTLTRSRTGSVEAAETLGKRLRGEDPFPQAYELVRITSAVFEEAVTVFEGYPDQGLSFTDATSVALCEQLGIDRILSFDDDFDGLVNRVDPSAI